MVLLFYVLILAALAANAPLSVWDPHSRAFLLILGLVGEYLGRLYLTANKRPQSTVRSVLRAAPAAAASAETDSARHRLRETA